MPTAAKSVIDGFRELLQDILVPELKALRVSMDSIRTEMHLRDEKTQESIRHLDLRTQEFIRHMDERTATLILHLDEKTQQSVKALDDRMQNSFEKLGQRLDYAIDIRERLVALETRLPKQ